MNKSPEYLLTDDNYAARGFVLLGERAPGYDGKQRAVGYDTNGRQLFDRKDITGAQQAAEKKGLRVVTTTYYGLPVRDGETAPGNVRRKAAEAAEKEARYADRDEWLPLGNRVGARYDEKPRDVIGDVEQSHSGNTILRVGSMIPTGGWQQTEHLVLTPAERDWLIQQLQAQAAKHPAEPVDRADVTAYRLTLADLDAYAGREVTATEAADIAVGIDNSTAGDSFAEVVYQVAGATDEDDDADPEDMV